jgi:hypothetical protein
MNDTDAINFILLLLKTFADEQNPISPRVAGDLVDIIEKMRDCERMSSKQPSINDLPLVADPMEEFKRKLATEPWKNPQQIPYSQPYMPQPLMPPPWTTQPHPWNTPVTYGETGQTATWGNGIASNGVVGQNSNISGLNSNISASDINTYPGGFTITNNSPPIEPLYAQAADGSYKDGIFWMGKDGIFTKHPPEYQYYVNCKRCALLYDFNKPHDCPVSDAKLTAGASV